MTTEDQQRPTVTDEPPRAVNRHNQTYTVLLIVLTFFEVLGVLTLLFMSRSPMMPQQSRWTFVMTACIHALFIAAMVVTLVLRATVPAAGRLATKALNIIMLILIPFGTALGIYGLWKVDKNPPAA